MTRRRLRSALAALLLLFAASSACAVAADRDALVARWVSASDAQIAKIADAKKRAAAAKAFANVHGRLDETTAAPMLPDFAAAARRELATPGRYHLSIKSRAAAAADAVGTLLVVVWDQGSAICGTL